MFDWSTEDVLNWLQSTVKLPQYAPSFRSLRITGRHLPKIASNEGQILQSVLGIFDSQHKQKIQLRAMDIVLFGPPVKESSLWKDLVVLSSILICVIGLLYVLRQRRHTQSKIDSFLEDLHTKEEELAKLKEKLSLQEMVSECVDAGEGDSPAEDITSSSSSPEQPGSPQTEDDLISEMSISSHDAYTHVQQAREEVGHYQRKVLSLEVQLERSRLDHKTLHELLLQAYRNERQHLDFRKKIAEDEMNRAQKVVSLAWSSKHSVPYNVYIIIHVHVAMLYMYVIPLPIFCSVIGSRSVATLSWEASTWPTPQLWRTLACRSPRLCECLHTHTHTRCTVYAPVNK